MEMNVNRPKVQFIKTSGPSQTQAPKEQLLITEHSVTEIANKIYMKKSGIVNPDVIASLRHLCKVSEKHGYDPEQQLMIFLMRQEILKHASELYFSEDIEQLFDESSDELEVIKEIIKTQSITR